MGVNAGDSYTFVLALIRGDGQLPLVTTTPLVQIINSRTGDGVLSPVAPMTLVAGTEVIYQYIWLVDPGTSVDDYIAIVSYAADGVTVNNRFLDRVRVGDSYLQGPVALDATVAKDDSVAKDATVAKSADLVGISPDNSQTVLAIKAQTDLLPADPASMTALASVLTMLTDVKDATIGSIVVDRTVSPRTMTFLREDGSSLATFKLTEDGNATSKVRQ